MTDGKSHARGRTEVKSYVPTACDEVADGPSLVEVRATETFRGDIEGEGSFRVIQAVRDGQASFAGIERVRGSIAGRSGTFLLQVAGTLVGKDVDADWFVVPGSGTGDLATLRGEGGFKAQLGEQGAVWLDYHLE
jgi:hypothetical protein